MRRILLLLLAACSTLALTGCHGTPGPKPLDELTQPEFHGHRVFQAHCAQCHYDRQTGPLHGPSLLGITKKPYLPSGAPANDDRILSTLATGRGMMPPQTSLDELEKQDLLAYLHTL